jgi:hypothetical protein
MQQVARGCGQGSAKMTLHTLNIANLPPAPWIKVPEPLQARMCFANKSVVLWDEAAGIHAEVAYPLKRGELAEAVRQLQIIGARLRETLSHDAEFQLKADSVAIGSVVQPPETGTTITIAPFPVPQETA